MMKKRLMAIFMSLAMAVGMCGCAEDWDDDDTYYEDDHDGKDSDSGKGDGGKGDSNGGNVVTDTSKRSSISMSLSSDGALKINRVNSNRSASAKNPKSWTIFVYICGADLESEYGAATSDIEEMINASTNENVKFVIQTGGANSWNYNFIDKNKTCRYIICDGEVYDGGTEKEASMGEGSTLTSFLKWGLENYSADRMGLVFWDHGSGSINGVCFDEKHDNDSLTLKEIDASLLSVYDKMNTNFEFIGFDACLMATLESANVLASYANYMFASEEVENGYGWNYTEIGKYLNKNIDADGAALGKKVADSYWDVCKQIGEESSSTFSIIDLSKINDVMTSFNDYSKELYEATDDSATFAKVVRQISSADNFGGNNKSEGYTNMVDLAGVVNTGIASGKADKVLKAIDNAVVYNLHGSQHKNACGLSTYYPLELQGSSELSIFGQIAVNPYYLSFVDRAAYGAVNSGNTNSYDNSNTMSNWGFFDYTVSEEEEDTYYESSSDNYDYWNDFNDYDSYEITGESPFVEFAIEPQLDEDGVYYFQFTEESYWYINGVYCNVLLESDDGEDLIDLGITTDVDGDWDEGIFWDDFDGYWFSFPDGQNLSVTLVSECDGYDVYTSPVRVNGKQTNIRIVFDYTNSKIEIDGIWDGIDENGFAARNVTKLEKGDVIEPLYDSYSLVGGKDGRYYGEEYVYNGNDNIIYNVLDDGNYSYAFYIEDLFGDYYVTDYAEFIVEDGEVYYR